MPIKEQIVIGDSGISTIKKLRDEHRSFKSDLKETKKELKSTWDKKYKPAIDNTNAVKSIKTLQKKADSFKSSLNTKVRLNDAEAKKLDAMKNSFKAFGKMVASPFVKLKGVTVSALNSMYQKMLRIGSMVLSPIVKIKDAALSKLKSSIKLFQNFGKKAISPIVRLKDYATAKIKVIARTLKTIGTKVVSSIIRLKDYATAKIKIIQGYLIAMKNKVVSVVTRVKDFATPKLIAIKNGLFFLGKLSIQPVVKLYDLATAGIKRLNIGLRSLVSRTWTTLVNLKGNALSAVTKLKAKLSSLTSKVFSPIVRLKNLASSKISKVTSEIKRLGKIVARPFITLKDNVTSKISPVVSKLKSFASKTYKTTVSTIDKTKSGISSAMKGIAGIAKKLVIPVAVAATVTTAAIGAAVKSGMTLENQQVSIEHFIGATNKDYSKDKIKEAAQSFTNALRENANATPFETGEVIAAGSRAIAITGGNTKSAMSMVKIAEDMAAASGGTKSVGDAIEALADAKLGEMERLKEFGFKVSAEEFKSKGFEGVSKDLSDFYGGASSKLATTGSGLMSTIFGKLKSGTADFGLKIVDQIKPVLSNIISFIDKAMPVIEKVGTAFGNSLGKGIQMVSAAMPSFMGFMQKLMPTFNAIGSAIGVVISAVGRIMPALAPVFSMITTTVGNIVATVLPPLSNAFSMIADVIVGIAPIITEVFGVIFGVIEGAISGISSVIQGGLDLISSIWNLNWQGVVDSFGSILGGIAEICKAPINAVISILNGAIDAINSVSIETPDWLPFGWGNQKLGFDLGHIDYLAKGGVVNKATPAIVGEAGKEAVMPLERNTGWIGKLAGQISSLMGGMSLNMPKLSGIIPMTPAGANGNTYNQGRNISIILTIAKLADRITVQDKEDIDDIADEVAKRIIEVAKNL